MKLDKVIKKIAKQHHCTPEHVRKEMEYAMNEAKKSTDPVIQARWAAIPREMRSLWRNLLIILH